MGSNTVSTIFDSEIKMCFQFSSVTKGQITKTANYDTILRSTSQPGLFFLFCFSFFKLMCFPVLEALLTENSSWHHHPVWPWRANTSVWPEDTHIHTLLHTHAILMATDVAVTGSSPPGVALQLCHFEPDSICHACQEKKSPKQDWFSQHVMNMHKDTKTLVYSQVTSCVVTFFFFCSYCTCFNGNMHVHSIRDRFQMQVQEDLLVLMY